LRPGSDARDAYRNSGRQPRSNQGDRRLRIILIETPPSALAASELPACLGDFDCLRPRVHVHVGLVAAGLASRDNGAGAVPANVRQGRGLPGLFARDHPLAFTRDANHTVIPS
jgi:hypothetical protein